MQVRFFGVFEAVAGGVPVPVRGVKQRTVLAVLALHRGKPVSADRLIDVLWGEGEVAHPVNALQAQIGQLRRTLGATAILTSDAGYALGIGPGDVDAARFEQLVAEGRRLLGEGARASPGDLSARWARRTICWNRACTAGCCRPRLDSGREPDAAAAVR